jgi:ATP-dependent DNA helicase RecG
MHFVPFPKNPTLAKFFIQLGRVDELGSGVINVNRFIQEYAEAGKPTFAEGHTFKMIIPIPAIEEDVKAIDGVNEGVKGRDAVNDGVNGGVNEGVKGRDALNDALNDAVKRRLFEIIEYINKNKQTKVADLVNKFNVSERTIKSHLKTLIEIGIVVYTGSKKFGYYTLNKNLHDKLHDKLHDNLHDKTNNTTK